MGLPYLVRKSLLGQVEAPGAERRGGRGARPRGEHALHCEVENRYAVRKGIGQEQWHASLELLQQVSK